MPQSTRAQLETLSQQYIKSNVPSNARTTGAGLRTVITGLITSMLNFMDDKDANDGYLGINSVGIVDITKIKKVVPSGQYLKDDGTWGSVAVAPTIANYTLAGSAQIDLTLYSGDVILNIIDGTDQTLNKLVNFSNVTKLTLRPRIGIDLTINDGSVLPFVSMKLAAPTLVCKGTNFGFLEMTKRNDGTQDQFFQTNFIDQYT